MGSSAGFPFVLVAVGLALTTGSIAGIIWLARRLKRQSTGMALLFVVGMLLLAFLGLAGVASVGCAAILPTHF